jgi:hypothetical protein
MTVLATILLLVAGVCFITGLKLLGKGETAGGATSSPRSAWAPPWSARSSRSSATSSRVRVLRGRHGRAVRLDPRRAAHRRRDRPPRGPLVKMTAMPEMVALFNGTGGIASLLIGWGELQKAWAIRRCSEGSLLGRRSHRRGHRFDTQTHAAAERGGADQLPSRRPAVSAFAAARSSSRSSSAG